MIKNKKGALALSQIFILIIGILAMAYLVGGNLGGVGGSDDTKKTADKGECPKNTDSECGGPNEKGIYCDKCCSPDEFSGKTYCSSTKYGSDGYYCNGKKIYGCWGDKGEKEKKPSSLTEPVKTTIESRGMDKATSAAGKLVSPKKTSKSWLSKFWKTPAWDILKHAGYAFGIGMVTKWVSKWAGETPHNANAIGTAAGGGYFVGWLSAKHLGITLGLGGWGIGFGVGAIILLFTYKNEKQVIVTYTCYAWDAETGGANCEECNNGDLPCTEYQCRSLGQGCELVNQGTEDEMCTWVDKSTEPAIIKAWQEVLTDGYEYDPLDAMTPPDRGVEITPIGTEECVPAFTPLKFGIELLENKDGEPKLARCKISTTQEDSYEDMPEIFFSNGIKAYEHSMTLSLPSVEALEAENITIGHGQVNKLYVRCEDVNGNSNLGSFIFQFCVDDEPDTTPPVIEKTDWIPSEGGPVAFGTTSEDITVYVNEPADCRWSHTDQAYDTMEDDMDCDSTFTEMTAEMLYACDATLNGIEDRVENKFYFRCKDNPQESDETLRNTMQESFEFTLIGTQPLIINSVTVNGEESGALIKSSTDVIDATLEVETAEGYDEGKSICYWSETGDENSYIMFNDDQNADNWKHMQDLWFPEGDYEYFIKCVDAGGNTDRASIEFTIETDEEAPVIVRAYHDGGYLTIMTNEEAECVYGSDADLGCNYNFEDGNSMTTVDDIEHKITWDVDKTLYLKCRDKYDNRPTPSGSITEGCSLIARPSEF